jgi:FAD/FMN-containing dehydrogenase
MDVEVVPTGIEGEVVTAGHPDYDSARRVWNGLVDRHPRMIVRCASSGDVAAGIAFARRLELPLAVRGGGHNVAGHATVDDGVVLDLAGLRHVVVDERARTVAVGGGATWGDVDAVTQRHALTVPGGVLAHRRGGPHPERRSGSTPTWSRPSSRRAAV